MKTRKKKIKPNKMLEAAHEMARGLYDAHIINVTTMREFDALCLPPVKELSPKEIKKIRLHARVSQAVFAMFLNTSVSTIKQWELGQKYPRGTSLKLLNIVADKGLQVLA